MCPSDKVVPHCLPHSPNRRPGATARTNPDNGPPTGKPHTAVYPRYRASQRPSPGGSTRVEGPRYRADGAAALVAGSDRRVTPHAAPPSRVESRTLLTAGLLYMFARVLPDHLEVMCQHPGHNHPAGRPCNS
jgi:hypothetical protein